MELVLSYQGRWSVQAQGASKTRSCSVGEQKSDLHDSSHSPLTARIERDLPCLPEGPPVLPPRQGLALTFYYEVYSH